MDLIDLIDCGFIPSPRALRSSIRTRFMSGRCICCQEANIYFWGEVLQFQSLRWNLELLYELAYVVPLPLLMRPSILILGIVNGMEKRTWHCFGWNRKVNERWIKVAGWIKIHFATLANWHQEKFPFLILESVSELGVSGEPNLKIWLLERKEVRMQKSGIENRYQIAKLAPFTNYIIWKSIFIV